MEIKLLFILALSFLLFLPLANALVPCYQETANVSTSCGGLDTGTYYTSNVALWTNYNYAIDGDKNTYGNTGSTATLYINYSKPINSTNATWQILAGTVNYTNITIITRCFNTSNDKISLYLNIVNAGTDYINVFCLNNTIEWDYITTLWGSSRLYEEAINWTIEPTPPTAKLSYTIPSGFSNPFTNVTLNCSDEQETNLTMNLTFNGVELAYLNHTNASIVTNETTLVWGTNSAIGSCSDNYNTTTVTLNQTIYYNSIILIDELTNTIFNLDNVTSAIVYFDNNRSSYDFKVSGETSINFTSTSYQLRFEFIYLDGTTIIRYVDTRLVSGELRVCVNKEGVTHNQQLPRSAIPKPVIIKNTYSDCTIASDYTRFAYQDAQVLQAWTTNTQYYLYTQSNGIDTYLASIDGSIASYINIDELEFRQEGYNTRILRDALSLNRLEDSNTVQIYYYNLAQDNIALTMTITQLNLDTLVYSYSEFEDFNEFTVNFDYTALPNVTNTTLFKIEIQANNSAGVNTFNRYFNIYGSSGYIASSFAFGIAVLLTIFGLTFTVSRITFGWFGMFIIILSLGALSFATSTWYINFFMVVDVIILVYIFLILTSKNYPTIS